MDEARRKEDYLFLHDILRGKVLELNAKRVE